MSEPKNLLEDLKENDPLEYHTRCFDTQKNTVLNLVGNLKQGQLARVLSSLLIYPLNDIKTLNNGKEVADLKLITQQEKLVFDFCLKMLDHKANVLRLGTEEIIKMGEDNGEIS